MTHDPKTARLLPALATRLSDAWQRPVTISDIEPVSMGASKAIWRFTATSPGHDPVRLVLRADPPEAPKPERMALEAAVLTAAHAQGAPVPGVVVAGADDGIGSPHVIMECVVGETLPQRILRDPAVRADPATLARELGAAIATVHRIPREAAGLPEVDDVADFEVQYRKGAPSPAMELGWRWLRENPPARHGAVVVHGDFRHGNIIVHEGHLAALLDWELAHIGDPLEDLGWVSTKAWRFGGAAPVGGFGEVADLLDGYAGVAGWRPAELDVLWWSVYGSIRWGIMCRRQAARHLEGDEQSLELALIGRRFAENEFDVLVALGLAEPHAADAGARSSAAEGAGTMFGAPTVTDILDAIVDERAESTVYSDRLLRSALNVVRRELVDGRRHEDDLAAALQRAGYRTEADLADAIRAGEPVTDAMVDAVRAGVEGRLLVWNPKYLGYPAPSEAFRVSGPSGSERVLD
ncbi:phosphotransferase family protein [Cumulibacter manganitolerans]|uniref:phosphotransferase family protein n=1 Tax=Cumulibacter manganitolerans TaxID=1884992 RepID=UPI001297FA58|nr:phosphotransferase [Cumulibacter manganitolerans]